MFAKEDCGEVLNPGNGGYHNDRKCSIRQLYICMKKGIYFVIK